jgi:uncharacterized protein
MRVGVMDIKQAPGMHKDVPVQIQLDPVEIGGQEIRFDEPFTGRAEIWNSGENLLVRAKLAGEAQVPCSRCLTTFSIGFKVSFDEQFVEGLPDEDDDEAEALEERTVTYYEGDEIDLTESLRDNVLLELPMKPLCRVDCKGLCPYCGEDKNLVGCDCKETVDVDPRLVAFKDLLRKPESDS